VHVLEVQWHCLTQDFTHPGLPWEPPAPECRSILAGGSGCLYALPMLVCPSYGEKMLWVLQAFFSVWADYFNIHRRSVSHGLDRLMATSMALRMVWIGISRIKPVMALSVIVPLFCYSRSHAAKARLDLNSWDGWKAWHFGWHLTGSLLSLGMMLVVHSCEAKTVEPRMFELMC